MEVHENIQMMPTAINTGLNCYPALEQKLQGTRNSLLAKLARPQNRSFHDDSMVQGAL